MINKKRRLIEILLVAVMLFPLVNAVAFSTSYHDKNPLTMAPGETKNIVVGWLQNNAEEDKTLEITLDKGSEIAQLIDSNLDSFVITAGSLNVPINLKVTIPEGAVVGGEYVISIRYKDITPLDSEGMVGFSETKISSIPVVIVSAGEILVEEEPTEESESNFIWWILGIVLIVIVILVIYMMTQKNSSVNQIPVKSNRR